MRAGRRRLPGSIRPVRRATCGPAVLVEIDVALDFQVVDPQVDVAGAL